MFMIAAFAYCMWLSSGVSFEDVHIATDSLHWYTYLFVASHVWYACMLSGTYFVLKLCMWGGLKDLCGVSVHVQCSGRSSAWCRVPVRCHLLLLWGC